MINYVIFAYHEMFIKAKLVHEDLELVLGEYPTWLLDYHIGDYGDCYVGGLLEMEGLEVLDYDTGKPLDVIEWIEAGWYDINKLDDAQGVFNDYINYLDDYVNIGEFLIKNTDYNIDPIATIGTTSGSELLIYDVLYDVYDYIVAGFSLTSSKPYKLICNDDNDYIIIDDVRYYLSDMTRRI